MVCTSLFLHKPLLNKSSMFMTDPGVESYSNVTQAVTSQTQNASR